MPQKSGKLNERERQIGKRLMQLRRSVDLSQSKFAKQIGLTHDQLASVEYGRTPLRYSAAVQIRKFFGFSTLWLARNEGPMFEHTPLADPKSLEVSEMALFSEVFDSFILPFFRPNSALDKHSETNLTLELYSRATFAEIIDEHIEDWLLELPGASLQSFFDAMLKAANVEGEKCGPDRWDLILQRRLRRGDYLEFRKKSPVAVRKNDLTEAATTDKTSVVKSPLSNLLKRLNERTSEPGKKSELAKFLGAPLASVSRWLSGDREPGGEITLKMLHWVELQERK